MSLVDDFVLTVNFARCLYYQIDHTVSYLGKVGLEPKSSFDEATADDVNIDGQGDSKNYL